MEALFSSTALSASVMGRFFFSPLHNGRQPGEERERTVRGGGGEGGGSACQWPPSTQSKPSSSELKDWNHKEACVWEIESGVRLMKRNVLF